MRVALGNGPVFPILGAGQARLCCGTCARCCAEMQPITDLDKSGLLIRGNLRDERAKVYEYVCSKVRAGHAGAAVGGSEQQRDCLLARGPPAPPHPRIPTGSPKRSG